MLISLQYRCFSNDLNIQSAQFRESEVSRVYSEPFLMSGLLEHKPDIAKTEHKIAAIKQAHQLIMNDED